MSIRVLNPNAEVLNKSAALHMNINAAKGLQDVLKTNLGPKGTIKMSVVLLFILCSIFKIFSKISSEVGICTLSGLLVELATLSLQRMVTLC